MSVVVGVLSDRGIWWVFTIINERSRYSEKAVRISIIWQYFRVVVDFETQTFDLWLGDSPAAVRDRPPDSDDYWNRNPDDQRAPVSTWLAFWIFDTVTATYVDDLVVYEGATPIGRAVEPTDKRATVWGEVKARY